MGEVVVVGIERWEGLVHVMLRKGRAWMRDRWGEASLEGEKRGRTKVESSTTLPIGRT